MSVEKTDWINCIPYSTVGKWISKMYRDAILFGFGLFLGASLVGYYLVIKKDDFSRGMMVMEQIMKDNPDYCQRVIVTNTSALDTKPKAKKRR